MGVNIAIYGPPRCGAAPRGHKSGRFYRRLLLSVAVLPPLLRGVFVSDYFCGVSQQGRLMELRFTTLREYSGCPMSKFANPIEIFTTNLALVAKITWFEEI